MRKTIVIHDGLFQSLGGTQKGLIDWFCRQIMKICMENYRERITVNNKIGAYMMDSPMFNLPPRTHGTDGMGMVTPEPYLSGTLGGVRVMVDPMMGWSDTRILLYTDKEIRKLKVKKALGELDGNQVTEICVLDENNYLL